MKIIVMVNGKQNKEMENNILRKAALETAEQMQSQKQKELFKRLEGLSHSNGCRAQGKSLSDCIFCITWDAVVDEL